ADGRQRGRHDGLVEGGEKHREQDAGDDAARLGEGQIGRPFRTHIHQRSPRPRNGRSSTSIMAKDANARKTAAATKTQRKTAAKTAPERLPPPSVSTAPAHPPPPS